MILIVDHREITVSYENNTLCVRREGGKLQRIPVALLEQVIVYGSPTIEMPVWRALSTAAVPTTLLSQRGSQEPAIMAAGLAVRLPLRRLQFRCAEHTGCAVAVARWFLQQKFAAYDLPLSHFNAEQRQPFKQQRAELLDKLNQADSIAKLMGYEGVLAAAWFALLAHGLPDKWRFNGRNRRPPQDPFNALLSLGYTLLMADIRQVLVCEGLDPAFGFLHQPVAGREALVLDFAEIFRAAVDFSLYAFLGCLNPKDFSYSQAHGCRLTKDARPTFYNFWAEFREQCPRLSADDEGDITFSSLAEQIRGKVAGFRGILNNQEQDNG
ncbi:CRISPR-associated endonuclease Cas1 [Methylovulum psychrotolerans]|nr:CRISPR-associated endonuclease Cas1 [Methylovulum psychrotolerans]